MNAEMDDRNYTKQTYGSKQIIKMQEIVEECVHFSGLFWQKSLISCFYFFFFCKFVNNLCLTFVSFLLFRRTFPYFYRFIFRITFQSWNPLGRYVSIVKWPYWLRMRASICVYLRDRRTRSVINIRPVHQLLTISSSHVLSGFICN